MPVNAATKKAAAEALAAIEQYDREGFECGVDRVHLHYSDVEGSWLHELAESELTISPAIPNSDHTPTNQSPVGTARLARNSFAVRLGSND
jgi:hypothetical protein